GPAQARPDRAAGPGDPGQRQEHLPDGGGRGHPLPDVADRPRPQRKPTIFRGFYSDASDKNVTPFKVLTEEESATRAAEFGGKVGLIEVEVFGTGKKPEEADPLTISMRGVSKRSLETHKPKDRHELQARVLKGAGLTKLPSKEVLKRGLIVGEDEPPAVFEPIIQDAFPNPYSLGSKAVRY